MKKPELLVTPTSVQDILPLIQAGATACWSENRDTA